MTDGAAARTAKTWVAPIASARAGGRAAALRWVVAVGGAVAVYSVFLWARGADPIDAVTAMWDSAAGDERAIGETLLRTTPLLLAALATAVPGRAGMFNIGAEGQLLAGAIGATGTAYLLDGQLGQAPTLVLMAIGGAAAGALWAAVPAVLRITTSANEAITTLLSNYLAGLVVTWLVFEPWKDPASLGQAYSRRLEGASSLPVLWGNRVNVGIVVAAAAAGALWWAFRSTRWGFTLRVLGGNPEAARRNGLRVGALTLSAFMVGGALAGLGGMLEIAGIEGRLRPDVLGGFGYIGFLASWLARHDPLRAVGAALLFASIAVGGFGLKIATGLSGAAVDILIALVLLAVLGFARSPKVAA